MEYFNYEGVQFIGNQEIPKDEYSDVERLFYDFVTTFESYWEDEPQFDRSHTDRASDGISTPPIDAACLYRLIDFAVKHCFTRNVPAQTS
jgi:hypothetical protein